MVVYFSPITTIYKIITIWGTGGKKVKANQTLKLKEDERGITRVVGGLIALLLTIIIGVLVFWSVNNSIDVPGAGMASQNTTTTMATTVFGLLPIVALVIVASIILGVILGFGGKGKSGL